MATKAKHAFGHSESIYSALEQGLINERDILFLDEDTDKPKIGWITKDGKPVILTDEKADLSEVEAAVTALETAVAGKASIDDVNSQINVMATNTVETAKAYTDGKIEAAVNEHLIKKFEIDNVPTGTVVDYRESEIRVMCPKNAVFEKQSVGPTGSANMHYMAFKAYAPEGAVGFKEGDRGVIVDEYFDFSGDFAGTDEYGRNYSICWLALASYDSAADKWTYFGTNSSTEKYVGWTYVVEWYGEGNVLIDSDAVRINLSNEECHNIIEPYYMSDAIKTVKEYADTQIETTVETHLDAQLDTKIETKIEEKISQVEMAYEIIEF